MQNSIVFKNVGEIYIDYDNILGQGSNGTVFLVKDRRNNKYALKVIDYKDTLKEDLLEEVQLLFRLKNNKVCLPGIICIYDYIVDDQNNKLYVLMEYVQGSDIFTIINQNREIFTKEVFEQIIEQGIEYLAYIHQHGIIHRDIKPENLMMKQLSNGEIELKFIDFGLSCEKYKCYGETGTRMFKPLFYNNCEISDMFSFGLTLFDIYFTNVLLYRNMDSEYTVKSLDQLVLGYEKGKTMIDKICAQLEIDDIYAELWKNMIEPTGLLRFTSTEAYSILKQNLPVKDVIPTEFQNCEYGENNDWDSLLGVFMEI